MTKKELRKIYKEKRSQLTFQQAEKYNDFILINFQQLQLPFISCMHTFLSSEKLMEPDTSAIIRYMQFKNPGVAVVAPKIDFASGKMQHLHFHEETELAENKYGILEPIKSSFLDAKEIDLVLVPLLAFDKKGSRVGYGKGHYDKFLATCRVDVIKIGISFFAPIDAIEDIDQFDIPLNFCATPEQVFEF